MFIYNRKNNNKSIIRDISFYNELNIRNSVYKNKYISEFFQ